MNYNRVVNKKFITLTAIIVIIFVALFFVVMRETKGDNMTTNKNYVAMGDSVASGLGVGNITDPACSRYDGAYPIKVASALGLHLTNISCSGATLPAGILGVQPSDSYSQLSKLFALPVPSVITLTIGANDADWITAIRNCTTGICGSDADKAAFTTKLLTISNNLEATFDQMKEHYGSNMPDVYLTGYYNILSPKAGPTLALLGINSANFKWITYMEDELNSTIKTASKKYDFVTYVPISFSGHELYTSSS